MKSDLLAPPLHPHRRFLMAIVWVIGILSAIQLGVALYIIPKFEAILAAMLSERELPLISGVVIRSRWVIAMLACLLPAAAWLLVRSTAPPKLQATFLAIGLCWSLVQVPLTVVALFIPFIGIVRTVSGG